MPASNHARLYRFGVYEADARSGELRKNGAKLKLQEQPFQVLAMLLERPGEVVTREEIRQRLWGGNIFVDFERGLATARARLGEAEFAAGYALGEALFEDVENLVGRVGEFFTNAEVVGGLWTNSLALLSDAAHVFLDLFALVLSLAAIKLSSMPASERHTYGFHRTEVFASFINGLTVFLMALGIFYEAWLRFAAPEVVKSLPMLVIAGIGLAMNLLAAKALHSHSHDDLNVKSAFLHVVGDAAASVGVIVGGVIMYFTGWYQLDALISAAIGLLIIAGAGRVLRDSTHILMEGTPRGLELSKVADSIRSVAGVQDVHHLNIWTVCSHILALSVHVDIDSGKEESRLKILHAIAAAALAAGDEHVAAVALEHAERGPVDVAEHRVGHAADKERHARTPSSDRRKELGELRARIDRRSHERDHLPQAPGDQPEESQPLRQPVDPEALRPAHRRHCQADPVGVRKQPEEDQQPEPVVALQQSRVRLFHAETEGLDQPAIVHARRARRFAGPAVKAAIQVMPHALVERHLALGHETHEVDPAARPVVFVADFGVRRARRSTQPAMHAIQEQAEIDSRRRIAVGRAGLIVMVIAIHFTRGTDRG